MQGNASPSHKVDQAVDCGLWNVVPLLFNNSMVDMSGEYAGHGKTRTFSASRNCVQILATWGRVLSY